MSIRAFAALCVVGAALSSAHADPTVLRLATIAPDGSSWARELKAFARDVERGTNGAVQVKWYYGAIAGDEAAAMKRIRAGQLDGMAGVMSCQMLSPSLHVTRLLGLFRTRDEVRHVYSRLLDDLRSEMSRQGFEGIAFAAFGFDILFSRKAVRSMDDLRSIRMWLWDLDYVWNREFPLIGFHGARLPVEQVARAYDHGDIDAIPALPTAALAFQWSAQTRYWLDMPLAFMPACMIVAHRAFDALTVEQRNVITAAGAVASHRFDAAATELDDALLGGLFEKQGIRRIEPSPSFRQEFLETANRLRGELGEDVILQKQLKRVMGWLADYRATHGQ
jgi:TRAP-type transport system periplasmic protein